MCLPVTLVVLLRGLLLFKMITKLYDKRKGGMSKFGYNSLSGTSDPFLQPLYKGIVTEGYFLYLYLPTFHKRETITEVSNHTSLFNVLNP